MGRDEGAERDHLAGGVAGLQAQQVLRLQAEGLIGLDVDLVGAAEAVEVVDVERAHEDLHGLEEVGQAHALRPRLLAVDVGPDLGHADLVAGEDAGQARVLGRVDDDLLDRVVQGLGAQARPVLDLHAEAAELAQALDRGRRIGGDHRVGDLRQLLVQLGHDGVGRQLRRAALVEVVEHLEHRALARAVDQAVHREAREGHRVGDAGRRLDDLVDLVHDGLGAIEGGGVGQLDDGDEVELVLLRHEAGGGAQEAEGGQGQEHAVDGERHGRLAQHPPHAADIAGGGAGEDLVERPKQPTEGAVDQPLEAVLPGAVRLQQDGGQGRRQGQGVERRDDRRDGDGQGELAVEQARQAGEEGGRHEHRAQHQRRGDDRAGHLGHGLFGRLDRRAAKRDVALDVLDHDDGVVDHDADGQDQAEQGQGVQPEAQHHHDREGADQRHGHGDQRDDRGAPALQEQDHHEDHQDQGLEQGVDHRIDGFMHEDGGVVDDVVLDPLGEILLQALHGGADGVGHLQGVGARALEDRQGDGFLVVEVAAQGVVVRAELDAGHVAQVADLASRARTHHDVAELLLGGQAALGVDGDLEVGLAGRGRRADLAGGDLDVLLAQGRDDVAGGHAAGRQLLGVQPDAHGIGAGAEHLHVAHAIGAGQGVLDVQLGVVGQVELVVAVIGRGQVHDHQQGRRGLGGGHADALHLLGQAREHLGHPVLHQHLGLVAVGAEGEGDGEVHGPVGGRLTRLVEHALDAVDGLFERRGDRLGDHRGLGAGIDGVDRHRGRDHLGIFSDGQERQGDQPRHQDDDRQHRREAGTAHEEPGEVHGFVLGKRAPEDRRGRIRMRG